MEPFKKSDHLTLLGMAAIKSTENNKVGKVLEKNWTPLFTAGGNIK